MITKTDYSTPDKKGKPQSTLSTGLGEQQQSYLTTQSAESSHLHQEVKVEPFDFNNFRSNQRKITMRMKQEEKLRKRRILKEVFNKIILTSYFNKKAVLIKIRQLPERYQPQHPQNQTAVDTIAKQLVFKTPLTAETAFLRSIINVRTSQIRNRRGQAHNKIQGNRKNSIANLNHSITIYPSEHLQLEAVEKRAIIFLQQMLKLKIARVVRCFRKNSFDSSFIKGYIRKCIVNLKQNQLNFLRKLRTMTKMHRENVMVAKRKSLHSLLTKCLQRRDKLIVQNLKACHQEKLLRRLVSLELLSRSQNYQKLSAFFAIYRQACKNNKEKTNTFQNSRQPGPVVENSAIRNLRFQIQSLRKGRYC